MTSTPNITYTHGSTVHASNRAHSATAATWSPVCNSRPSGPAAATERAVTCKRCIKRLSERNQ